MTRSRRFRRVLYKLRWILRSIVRQLGLTRRDIQLLKLALVFPTIIVVLAVLIRLFAESSIRGYIIVVMICIMIIVILAYL